MKKFPKELKKPVFYPFLVHFPILMAEKFFQENPTLSHTTSNGFLAPCQNSKKKTTNDAIPRKQPDRWEDRETEGQKDIRMNRPYLKGLYLGVQKASMKFIMIKLIL